MKSSNSMALLAAVMIPVASANAGVLVFDLDGVEGSTSFSKTVGGITLNLTNPLVGSDSEGSNVFAFLGVSPALTVTGAAGILLYTFNFTFDAPVTITGYTVRADQFEPSGTGAFSLSAPGSTTSSGNSLETAGFSALNGTVAIAANTVGTFITEGMAPTQFGGPIYTIVSISVATVPEPGEWATLSAAACAGTALFLRRRRAK